MSLLGGGATPVVTQTATGLGIACPSSIPFQTAVGFKLLSLGISGTDLVEGKPLVGKVMLFATRGSLHLPQEEGVKKFLTK